MTASELQAWLTNDHVDGWRAATFSPSTYQIPTHASPLCPFWFYFPRLDFECIGKRAPSQGSPILGFLAGHVMGFDPYGLTFAVMGFLYGPIKFDTIGELDINFLWVWIEYNYILIKFVLIHITHLINGYIRVVLHNMKLTRLIVTLINF